MATAPLSVNIRVNDHAIVQSLERFCILDFSELQVRIETIAEGTTSPNGLDV